MGYEKKENECPKNVHILRKVEKMKVDSWIQKLFKHALCVNALAKDKAYYQNSSF